MMKLIDEAERAVAQRAALALAEIDECRGRRPAPARGRPVETAQDLQQRRLARARRADDREALAGRDRKLTPRSTSSVSGPWRKLLQTRIGQQHRRQSWRNASAGVVRAARQAGYSVASTHSAKATAQTRSTSRPLDIGRQIAHEIHARIQKMRAQHVLQSVHQLSQIMRHEHAERRAAAACRPVR